MSAPGLLNLTFGQGTTWKLSMVYSDGDGVAIDLSDYTAELQARTTYGSSSVAVNLTNGSGITLGTAGSVSIVVDAVTTSSIEATQYVYDMEITSGSGEVTRLIEGTLVVTPEVTR